VRTLHQVAVPFNPCNNSASGVIYDYLEAKQAKGRILNYLKPAAEDEPTCVSAVLHETLLHTQELPRRLQLAVRYDPIRKKQKKKKS